MAAGDNCIVLWLSVPVKNADDIIIRINIHIGSTAVGTSSADGKPDAIDVMKGGTSLVTDAGEHARLPFL